MTPPPPVGSVPASSIPPARTKSTSSCRALGNSVGVARARVARVAAIALLELLAENRIEHVEPRRHRPAGRERLEHGERGRERDVVLYEIFNERLDGVADRVDGGDASAWPCACPGQTSGFLSATKSVATKKPCSRLSMPSSAASR